MRYRKSIMFTLIVLIFLAVITVLAFSLTRIRYEEKQSLYQSRIMGMNDFLASFEADSERAIYISTFRTLVALEDYVSHNAKFLNDTSYYFQEVFYEGRIENTTFEIMNESTFHDYQRKVNEIANQVNMEFNSTVNRIDLSMKDPWTIRVGVDMFVNLTDRTNLAKWEYNTTIYAELPIFDIRDPLYSVNTLGKLPVTIKKTNVSIFVNDSNNQNDTFNLQVHLNNSFYINNSMAPNFLMRFENNLSPDKNGIESLVNLQVLADQGWTIDDNNRSVVDYIYFSETDTDNYCTIQGMVFTPNNWFILDKAHAEIYQVNTTVSHTNC
ncbi:MAG: hypothetical protein V1743_05690 [Nanoarchaeota archaeon]